MVLRSQLSEEIFRLRPLRAARALEGLSPPHAAALLGAVAPTAAAAAIETLSPPSADAVLAALPPPDAAAVLAVLEPDVAARLARGLTAERRNEVFAHIEPPIADDVRRLLDFPENTAGALMDPTVMALASDLSIDETLGRIRDEPDRARYNLYVVDRRQSLVGVVNLRELLLQSSSETLAEIMIRDPVFLEAGADRSRIVGHPGWKRVHSIPVVDDQHRYLGAVRYRTLRRLEQELFGRAQADTDAAEALGELFSSAAAGLVEALGATGRKGIQ